MADTRGKSRLYIARGLALEAGSWMTGPQPSRPLKVEYENHFTKDSVGETLTCRSWTLISTTAPTASIPIAFHLHDNVHIFLL